MKKGLYRLVIIMMLLVLASPVSALANTNTTVNIEQTIASTGASIEELTDNQWLRQIIVLPEEVERNRAQAIIEQLEKYNDNVLEGLAINKAQIKLVDSLEGLSELPEGTDGAKLDSYLTTDKVLYLKLTPSNTHDSSHFILQQAALLMNSVIFNDIFSSSTYRGYYNSDKDFVAYGSMNQLDFFAESLAYFTYPDYTKTEIYKAQYARYYLYYLYYYYIPEVVINDEVYIKQIVEYPQGTYDHEKAKLIVEKLRSLNSSILNGLAMNGAKLKLVNSLEEASDIPEEANVKGLEAYLNSPNELFVEIGGEFKNVWSSDELLRQIILWVDASLWYKTSESLDYNYVYNFSYPYRNFATQYELTATEFFSEAIVRYLKGLSLTGEKMESGYYYMSPVYYYVNLLIKEYKPMQIDYNNSPVVDPIVMNEAEKKRLDKLMPQVVQFTEGADYDKKEAQAIVDRLKRFGSEVIQGMVYNEIKIRLTAGPITDEPEMSYLKDVTPRGWPEEYTWADVPGAGWNPVFSRINHSYYGMGHSTINLELHETAHILDYYLFDEIGLSEEWAKLHKKEAISLFGNDGYMSIYPEEYFAEVSAYYLLSGHTRAKFAQLAPETYKAIEKLYSTYKAVNPFDPAIDAQKTKLIDKLLIEKNNGKDNARKNAVNELKKLNVELLKGLVGNNIKYSVKELGKSSKLKNITSVNPILNQVARDIDKYVLKGISKSSDFKTIFDKESIIIDEPKQPKSLFYDQPIIAKNADEYFAEATAMYFNNGVTKHNLSRNPETWDYLDNTFETYKWESKSKTPNKKSGKKTKTPAKVKGHKFPNR